MDLENEFIGEVIAEDEDNQQVEIIEVQHDYNDEYDDTDYPTADGSRSNSPVTTECPTSSLISHVWSTPQIDALLQLRFEMHALFESSDTKKNHLWQQIASRMQPTASSGDSLSAEACSTKFKNLCNTYRTIKARVDHVDPKGRSTFRGTRWPYYAQFDAVFGRLAATPRRSRSYFYEFCSDVLKTFPEPPRRDRISRRAPRAPDPKRSQPLLWLPAMMDALVHVRLQRAAAFRGDAAREHYLLWREIAAEVQQHCAAAGERVYGGECYRKFRLLLKTYRRQKAARATGATDGTAVRTNEWKYWSQFHEVYGDKLAGCGSLPSPQTADDSQPTTNTLAIGVSNASPAEVAVELSATSESATISAQTVSDGRNTLRRRQPLVWHQLQLARSRFRHQRQHNAATLQVRREQASALERIAVALEGLRQSNVQQWS